MLSARASLLCCHGTPPLVLAVQTGNAELVRLLITLGADLNATSTASPMPGTRLSPLAEAAARKDMQIFNMLLTAGANINVCDSTDGLTPLQAAILSQARDCIDTLLQHQETDVWKPSASITRIDALVASILANDILLFDFLIQIASQQTIIPAFDLQNMAVAAMQADDPYFLDRVIDMGANLYYPDVAYCASTSVSRLQRLLDRGLQLDNFVGNRTFFDAVLRGALDRGILVVVKYLIGLTTCIEAALIKELCRSLKEWASFCFSRNMKERRAQSREILELLYQRLSNDHVMIISGGLGTITAILDLRDQHSYLSCPVDALLWKLLEAGFRDFDCHCVCDRQALYWACHTGSSELVQRLLESGISPTCPRFCSMHNKTWSPALEVSAKKGDAASVSVLIAHGAEVNPTCEAFCNTPLESACRSGELEVVKMLLRHGAKHTFNDGSRESTALMIAAAHDNPDVVSELIAYGAEVNAAPSSKSWSSTALTEACEHGHVDVVKVLIINKADINAPASSEDGFTALQAAAINGHGKICQILVEQGADIAAPASSGDGFTAIDGAAKFGRIDILKYLLDNYSGGEPIEAVCKRARNVALAHWQDHVANMILNYRKPI